MPEVKFGTNDEPGFQLEPSKDLIAVRTHSRRSILGAGPVLTPAAAEVSDASLVVSFPEAGVEVYRISDTERSVDERKRGLRAAPDVQFAGSVLVRPGSDEPVLYTENIYIRFKEGLDPDVCEEIIREAGLTVKERLEYATNAYSVAAPEGTGQEVFAIALNLLKRDDVIYCHPELIERRVSRQIFPEQWHLKSTSLNGVTVNAHCNVEAAHAITRGAGITIAVIDDGVDVDHPEFSRVGKIVAPRDATLGTSDPRPKDTVPDRRFGENHGTACAGVACADGTDGASGVAPLARLMPIRLRNGLGSFREAEAFRWAADNGADIISCSWGPPDGSWWDNSTDSGVFQLPASTRDAIDYAVTQGRGGKGCLILFAAGNGNESVDKDGYASYEKVIAVAACNDRGKRSVYSDFGDAIWCAFPSSDFGHPPFNHPEPLTRGIWTIDRQGRFGYNPGSQQFGTADGNYANDFGGTSSSCPGAAGVAALVLSANRALRWNEVKDILRRACDPIDPSNGQYDADGHSKLYGYGRLNAGTAVTLAKQAVGRMILVNKLLNEPIPDLGSIEATLDITETVPAEKLAVSIQLDHTWTGDLVITVVPPAGVGNRPIVLHNRAGGSRKNIDMLYDPSNTPALKSFIGKACNGIWTVRVEDKASQDSGTLIQIGIQLFLPAANPLPGLAERGAEATSRSASKKKTATRRPRTKAT